MLKSKLLLFATLIICNTQFLYAEFQFFEADDYQNAPTTLSSLGVFTDITNKVMDPLFIPYEVNVPSWQSGLKMDRYVILPADSQITYFPDKEFGYPEKTFFIQNIYHQNGNTKFFVETRITSYFQKWNTFSYRWKNDQTDADLGSQIFDRDTTYQFQGDSLLWKFSAPSSCLKCHLPGKPQVLGFIPSQINRTSILTQNKNQIQHFFDSGLLAGDIPDLNSIFTWINSRDTTADIEQRVRSYFSANCSNCHFNKSGYIYPGQIYGNIEFSYLPGLNPNYLNSKPSTLGVYRDYQEYRYVWGGQPDSSVLLMRMDKAEMPPENYITQKDSFAVEMVKNWIENTVPSPTVAPVIKKRTINKAFEYKKGILKIYQKGYDSVQMYDLTGKEINLNRINKSIYVVKDRLNIGLYFLKTSNQIHYLHITEY